jgi:hypothetical protein
MTVGSFNVDIFAVGNLDIDKKLVALLVST